MDMQDMDSSVVVSPKGKLDTIHAPNFSKELLTMLEKKPKICVIDLSGVSFLSSSGLQALLAGAKKSKKNGVKYGVCGMNKMVKDVFMLSGFDRFIDSFNDAKDAIEKL